MKWKATTQSITVWVDGETYILEKSTNVEKFEALSQACLDNDEDRVCDLVCPLRKKIKATYGSGNDQFLVEDGLVIVNGEELPRLLGERLYQLADKKLDYTPLLRFWERLRQNPSMSSVQQLFDCLEHNHHPLYPDGYFKAYKGVSRELMDLYSGTIKYELGKEVRFPRNKVDDTRSHACSFGLHVGSFEYAFNYAGGGLLLECKVDPADVVSVPTDFDFQKMRVCALTPVAIIENCVEDKDEIVGGGMAYVPPKQSSPVEEPEEDGGDEFYNKYNYYDDYYDDYDDDDDDEYDDRYGW